ncbi:MAG: helicase C-terminal domain-containing protein [Planctomycetota bacterium]
MNKKSEYRTVSNSGITEMFSPGGALSQYITGYEVRSVQLQMAESVYQSLKEQQHLLIEAGTGVGKSLAYLLPAVAYAKSTGFPVAISTFTINLQEQLINKDIPVVKKCFSEPFTYALAKGRGNYLCSRRLYAAIRNAPTLFPQDRDVVELGRIADWSQSARDGSYSELEPQPYPYIWHQVSSSLYTCLGRGCLYHERCFYMRARRAISTADIVVTNHALFFTDLAHGSEEGAKLLPQFGAVIFDEAHIIEDVASECLGLNISENYLNYFFDRLRHSKKKRGLLSKLASEDAEAHKQATNHLSLIRKMTKSFFNSIDFWIKKEAPENLRIRKSGFVEDNLSSSLTTFADILKYAAGVTRDNDTKVELNASSREATAAGAGIGAIVSNNNDSYVYWIEKDQFNKDIALRSAPIKVSELLNELLFSQGIPIILTGATIAVGKKAPFAHLKERLGVDSANEVILGSAFDFKKQAKLLVMRNIPKPNEKDFPEALSKAIKESIMQDSSANTLVLFTSYELMDKVYAETKHFFEGIGISVHIQGGELSRSKMIKRMHNHRKCVLFGSDSFWQGVDLPGESLKRVIITRLPFTVPTRPISEARAEALEKEGQDPFYHLSLPHAVLKLKQGFGRLIRTKTDTGEVIILDSRIITRGYGAVFLESLPLSPTVITDTFKTGKTTD